MIQFKLQLRFNLKKVIKKDIVWREDKKYRCAYNSNYLISFLAKTMRIIYVVS